MVLHVEMILYSLKSSLHTFNLNVNKIENFVYRQEYIETTMKRNRNFSSRVLNEF